MSYNTKRSEKWNSGIFICIVTVADDEFVGRGGESGAGSHQPNGKDDEHVSINYEVEDADGDLMTVSVKVSDDGGKTFHFIVPREQLSGDVGGGISSERRKEYRR